MLSLLSPEIVSFLAPAGPGVFPLRRSDTGLYVLAVKGSGDMALAAKLKASLRFHLFDLVVGARRGTGVLTAIYDRENSPIVVRTICADPFNRDLMAALQQNELEVGFFDMHTSEIFSGLYSLQASGPYPAFMANVVSDDQGPTLPVEFHVELEHRFAGALDDGFVIDAALLKSEQVPGVVHLHMTVDEINSASSEQFGLYRSQLEIDERPGDFQEPEVGRLLGQVFGNKAIYLRPRTNKRPEFSDVLALGKLEAISVQAKSTLRNQRIASESIEKRARRFDKQFKEALKQAIGAERAFYHSRETIMHGDQVLDIDPMKTLLIHIVLISEKVPSLLDAWSTAVAGCIDQQVMVIVLDTAEFHSLVTMFRDRDGFVAALMTLVEGVREHRRVGEYVFGKDRVAIK